LIIIKTFSKVKHKISLSAIPHFLKLDNSSIIARQNARVALASPVLQYKKPRCGGCIGHCHHLSVLQVLLKGRARKIYPRTFGVVPHVLGAKCILHFLA